MANFITLTHFKKRSSALSGKTEYTISYFNKQQLATALGALHVNAPYYAVYVGDAPKNIKDHTFKEYVLNEVLMVELSIRHELKPYLQKQDDVGMMLFDEQPNLIEHLKLDDKYLGPHYTKIKLVYVEKVQVGSDTYHVMAVITDDPNIFVSVRDEQNNFHEPYAYGSFIGAIWSIEESMPSEIRSALMKHHWTLTDSIKSS